MRGQPRRDMQVLSRMISRGSIRRIAMIVMVIVGANIHLVTLHWSLPMMQPQSTLAVLGACRLIRSDRICIMNVLGHGPR